MPAIIGKATISDVSSSSEEVEVNVVLLPEGWEGSYDRLELWRSTISPSGPFEALTSDSWKPAAIPSSGGEEPSTPVSGRSVVLTGLQLLLCVDEMYDFVVTFSSQAAVTYAQAATTITSQGAGRFRAYVDSQGHLVLVGTRPGTGSSLEVTGGDAAVLLGLPTTSPYNKAFGQDAHMCLLSNKQQYQFVDLKGNSSYYYRYRMLNSATRNTSAFSESFSAEQALGISFSNIACGYVDLVGTDGRPLADQLVQVYATTQASLVEGRLVTGSHKAKLTDQNGHADFTLVRGVRYSVTVSGTDIVREILVPTGPSIVSFNLFAQSVGVQDDLFTVDRPAVIYAERRTL